MSCCCFNPAQLHGRCLLAITSGGSHHLLPPVQGCTDICCLVCGFCCCPPPSHAPEAGQDLVHEWQAGLGVVQCLQALHLVHAPDGVLQAAHTYARATKQTMGSTCSNSSATCPCGL